MTKGSALPLITDQSTGEVEVDVLDPTSDTVILTHHADTREAAERYVRAQLDMHERTRAMLPTSLRFGYVTPIFEIDGDEYDGEVRS